MVILFISILISCTSVRFLVNSIKCDFEIFKESLFTCNHSDTICRFSLIHDWSELIFLSWPNILVSSANINVDKPFDAEPRSLIYNKNNNLLSFEMRKRPCCLYTKNVLGHGCLRQNKIWFSCAFNAHLVISWYRISDSIYKSHTGNICWNSK